MFIKGFNLSFNANKKKIIVIFMITLAILSIVVYLVINKTPNQSITNDSLFNISKYECKYEVSVTSNKNSNRYKMQEWYLNDGMNTHYKFKTMGIENNLEYIISNNTLKLVCDNEINQIQMPDYYIVTNKNLLSIVTFFSLYNKIGNSNESSLYYVQTQEFEDNICYRIVFNIDKIKALNETNELINEYNSILRDGMSVSKLELIVKKENDTPKEYIIYNKEDIAYIDILYTDFKINGNFDQKLFAF